MLKILIVDDSVFSQKITSNFIKKFLINVEFFFANNGKDGFIKYKNIKPDYIFIDLLMPEVNGKQLLKLIKELDNDAKIFVVSADVQKGVKEEIESYNIMSFVNKPFNEEKAKRVCDMIREEETND